MFLDLQFTHKTVDPITIANLDEDVAKVVKKRIELVRSNSLESVRVSARQAERKAMKASRDNSEDGRMSEENLLGKVKR